MFPYWILFLVPVWMAATRLRPIEKHNISWTGRWYWMFIFLLLMVGLRYEVGGDWRSYSLILERVSYGTLSENLNQGDPAYQLLNWLAVNMGGGIYLVNMVCAALFAWGLLLFCRAQPRPWLALVVAMPYMVTVVAMGYTRQATAIGLAMGGLVALSDRKTLRFALFIALAALFHKSAVILLPLAVLATTRRKLWTVFWVGISSVLLYVLLLQDALENLRYGYLEAQYDSSGAAIRVAMNAFPAIIFLAFRRRFVMPDVDRVFWTWMSIGGLGFVYLLVVSSSSTAVDRVALYWIPLQLFVLSRLPDALGKHGGKNAGLVWMVIFYSASVLLVWLVFANHSRSWLPYQFYPWVELWN